jgi:uncharacterized protein (DUF433 family)
MGYNCDSAGTGKGGDPVQLEDYFDFLSPLDIRVKGTRVGIETILTARLDHNLSAEEIAADYWSLTLEQVNATLEYYRQNTEQVREYLRRVDEEIERQRAEQERNPHPGIVRLRALREELRRQATEAAGSDSGSLYDEHFRRLLREYKRHVEPAARTGEHSV